MAAEQRAIEGIPFSRHASERGHESSKVPDNKLDVVPNALGWRLGHSNSAILARASRDKRGDGTQVRPSLRANVHSLLVAPLLPSSHTKLHLERFDPTLGC